MVTMSIGTGASSFIYLQWHKLNVIEQGGDEGEEQER